MTLPRPDLCTKVFYGAVELFLLGVGLVLGAWYFESKLPVVDFNDVPGYRIIEVTGDYIEVKWVEAALLTDCPGRVEPLFVGETGSYALPSYPFIVEHSRKTFTRRYVFPPYLRAGDYQLRINMISKCNPVFEGRQVLRVDFYKPAENF